MRTVTGADASEGMNIMVRAKFKLQRVECSVASRQVLDENGVPKKDPNNSSYTLREPCEMRTLVLSPVYGNGDPNHENTKFWEASPSGEIKLGTVNEAAWSQFELGKEYYIDFTPAE
jgi:hypothetical protein